MLEVTRLLVGNSEHDPDRDIRKQVLLKTAINKLPPSTHHHHLHHHRQHLNLNQNHTNIDQTRYKNELSSLKTEEESVQNSTTLHQQQPYYYHNNSHHESLDTQASFYNNSNINISSNINNHHQTVQPNSIQMSTTSLRMLDLNDENEHDFMNDNEQIHHNHSVSNVNSSILTSQLPNAANHTVNGSLSSNASSFNYSSCDDMSINDYINSSHQSQIYDRYSQFRSHQQDSLSTYEEETSVLKHTNDSTFNSLFQQTDISDSATTTTLACDTTTELQISDSSCVQSESLTKLSSSIEKMSEADHNNLSETVDAQKSTNSCNTKNEVNNDDIEDEGNDEDNNEEDDEDEEEEIEEDEEEEEEEDDEDDIRNDEENQDDSIEGSEAHETMEPNELSSDTSSDTSESSNDRDEESSLSPKNEILDGERMLEVTRMLVKSTERDPDRDLRKQVLLKTAIKKLPHYIEYNQRYNEGLDGSFQSLTQQSYYSHHESLDTQPRFYQSVQPNSIHMSTTSLRMLDLNDENEHEYLSNDHDHSISPQLPAATNHSMTGISSTANSFNYSSCDDMSLNDYINSIHHSQMYDRYGHFRQHDLNHYEDESSMNRRHESFDNLYLRTNNSTTMGLSNQPDSQLTCVSNSALDSIIDFSPIDTITECEYPIKPKSIHSNIGNTDDDDEDDENDEDEEEEEEDDDDDDDDDDEDNGENEEVEDEEDNQNDSIEGSVHENLAKESSSDRSSDTDSDNIINSPTDVNDTDSRVFVELKPSKTPIIELHRISLLEPQLNVEAERRELLKRKAIIEPKPGTSFKKSNNKAIGSGW